MSEIRRYIVVNQEGDDVGAEHDTFDEAQTMAVDLANVWQGERHFAVLTNVYERTDSELAWATNGSEVWPS